MSFLRHAKSLCDANLVLRSFQRIAAISIIKWFFWVVVCVVGGRPHLL